MCSWADRTTYPIMLRKNVCIIYKYIQHQLLYSATHVYTETEVRTLVETEVRTLVETEVRTLVETEVRT